MNKTISQDRLAMMKSLLDQELDVLSASDFTDKENFHNQKPLNDFSSKKLTNSLNSLLSSNKANPSSKEPYDITNQNAPARNQIVFSDPPRPDLKVHKDLLDLQSKISSLEKKLVAINSQGSPKSPNEYNLGISTNSNKILEERRLGKEEAAESPDYSPLKKKYGDQSMSKNELTTDRLTHSITDSSPFREDSIRKSLNSSPSTKRTSSARKSSGKKSARKSGRKVDNNVLELSIKEAQGELEQTKLRQRSSSKGKTKSSTKLGSARKKKAEESGELETGNYHDVVVLNKKLMELRKEEEEQRAAILTERTQNQELVGQFERLSAKAKKMKGELDKFGKVEADYNKLMEAFEKSEYIRNQQKALIASMQQEIETLKRQNEGFQAKMGESVKNKTKKTSGTKTKKL